MNLHELWTSLKDDVGHTSAAEPLPLNLPVQALFRHASAEDVKSNPLVMIVDDEPVNVKLVRRCLSLDGYKDFILLTDSTSAVSVCVDRQPDILLLDIMMPEVSGMKILAQLRADERFRDLPIVILTAAADPQTKMEALRLGATDFLTKPIDHAELLARVRNVLSAKANHDALKRLAWELQLQGPIALAEVHEGQHETAAAMARMAALRAGEAADSPERIGRLAGRIAARMGLDVHRSAAIEYAAMLCDAGKLLLNDDELASTLAAESAELDLLADDDPWQPADADLTRSGLERHAEAGARVLAASRAPLFRAAARAALTHHERWDGRGGPQGLAAAAIPLEGRIAAVAWSYLRARREYGREPAECLATVARWGGHRFDPEVVAALEGAVEGWQEGALELPTAAF